MKDNSFPKQIRLLNKSDFANLRSRNTRKLFLKTIKLIYQPNDLSHGRLGFAVSRKVGKANVRNLLKRNLREWFRQSSIKDKPFDMMIIVHPKWKAFGSDAFLKALQEDLDSVVVKI